VDAARIPLATYRLQFNRSFTFRDADAVSPYLRALGISDCYASSYLTAVPGSPHGYDVVDPTRLNPDVGTDAEYAAWMRTLQSLGMGQVLDLVPNHMGIAKSANPWWTDVLENGPSSRYARFFDIEWHPVKDELADKVLIPILGDQYGAVLEASELRLAFHAGAFTVHYAQEVLPIAPDTYGRIFDAAIEEWSASHPGPDCDELLSVLTASDNLPPRGSRDAHAISARAREKEVVKRRLHALVERSADVADFVAERVAAFNGVEGEPRSFDALDALLNAQSYRLAHWRVASEEINYRRFFDVNELAALRMEDPAVFDEVHRFVFELVDRGAVTGLRIDHVDGLFAPAGYLRQMQARASSASGGPPLFIVVEKILGAGEALPPDWPVSGTTGYEFGAMVNGLFVDRRHERAMDEVYRRFVRHRVPFAELAYTCRKRVLHETMSGDINSLGHQLNRFSERNRHFRDFTLYSLISAMKEVIACFPVYRTYITADLPPSDDDRRYIRDACRCARRRSQTIPGVVFDFIERLLLMETRPASDRERDERAVFVGKFQQVTSPVAAKAIEDTAFYRDNRLLSLNEVGSDPTRFGVEPIDVHQWMIARQRRWPAALSATSTHDTKRGEDVRARISVLSEMPAEWKTAVARWRALNRRFKTDRPGGPVPDANDEYFLYQTLVGAWPFEADRETHSGFTERIVAYVTKALRESKAHTSWSSPDEEYEAAAERFVRALLDRSRVNPFLDAFLPFQARVAALGVVNSLAQLVIKVTAPGIPDFYQGTELWDLALVDPDNRRPVDYDLRRDVLRTMQGCPACAASDMLAAYGDGRVKMFVAHRALAARASLRDLYERGAYVPLRINGPRQDHLFAFARVDANGRTAISCVPRLTASLSQDGKPPLGDVWAGTWIELPADSATRTFRDALIGEARSVECRDGVPTLSVPALFDRLPVALLVPLA
jgi:(1->4)-alpha-D-glucan 1-alpha-D-glucosylmutase